MQLIGPDRGHLIACQSGTGPDTEDYVHVLWKKHVNISMIVKGFYMAYRLDLRPDQWGLDR